MKVKEIIEEEPPQSIPVLDRDEIAKSIHFCLQHVNSAKEIESITTHVKLYQVDISGVGYYFVYDDKKTNDERIQYFVKYSTVDFSKSIIPSKAMRQVLVWRNPTNATVVGIAKDVFWNHLWPKYKCLASDSQQTTDGQRFWSSAVGSALQKGLTVRIINTNDNTFKDTTSLDDFSEAVPGTWGTTKWFQRMIVIIFE